jgi:hypothetical protein
MTVMFRGKTGPKRITTNFYKMYTSSGYLTQYLEYFRSALYSEQFTTTARSSAAHDLEQCSTRSRAVQLKICSNAAKYIWNCAATKERCSTRSKAVRHKF